MKLALMTALVVAASVLLSACGDFGNGDIDENCRITDIAATVRKDESGNQINAYSFRYLPGSELCSGASASGSWNVVTLEAQERVDRANQRLISRWTCATDPWTDQAAQCTRLDISSAGSSPISTEQFHEYSGAFRPVTTIALTAIERDTLRGQLGNALKQAAAQEQAAAARASATGPDGLLDYGGCACGESNTAPAPKPSAAPTPPLVQKNASGPRVEALQLLLNQAGADVQVDGDFGDQSEAAVKVFQQKKGLQPADGKVNAATWSALFVSLAEGASQDDAVKALQTLLSWNGIDVEIDGDFGDQTDAAVQSYQKLKGINESGRVGPLTWTALLNK